jgi:hypothetical protein
LATTITNIDNQYRIETDSPIWWVSFDDEFWYNKGFLEVGVSDVGTKDPICFDSENEQKEFIKNRKQFIEEF